MLQIFNAGKSNEKMINMLFNLFKSVFQLRLYLDWMCYSQKILPLEFTVNILLYGNARIYILLKYHTVLHISHGVFLDKNVLYNVLKIF